MAAARVCSLMRARLISSSVPGGGGVVALGASVGVASTHTPESILDRRPDDYSVTAESL